ncbi:MAG: HTTM domain-containing protein [Bacteroidota bacterium]
MITLDQLIQSWNAFFFEPVPVYTVALFRIIFGIILLREAVFLMGNLGDYLGPNGMVSYERYYQRSHKKVLSLFLYLPGTMAATRLIMAMHFLFVLMMTLGLFTPISTALTFVTMRSIVNRNPALCNGGDNVSRTMCFYLIFASAGHAYSLDEYFFYAPTMPGKAYLLQSPWALRLMQIQVSIIYLYTTYWKLKGATYRQGTAIYYVMGNFFYRRFQLPKWMLRTPFVQMLSWGTLAAEAMLGIGLWIKEFRYPTILLGLLLHLTIEYIVSVHLFGWYMMTSLLLFLDPMDVMHWVSQWLA